MFFTNSTATHIARKVSHTPASIVCVGNRWFPDAPGGLDRYIYEMVYSLAALHDQVELCGAGLPSTSPDSPLLLTNLADPERPLYERFWHTRSNYRTRKISSADAVNLHFALYGFPLLSQLPNNVPVTFHFHGPWALESDREGSSKLGVTAKRWIENRVYRRCDRFITLSHAFGKILHKDYGIPWEKINVIPGGVNIDRFQLTLERSQARDQLSWPQNKFILFTPRRLVHRMGVSNLLAAIADIKEKIPEKAAEIWLAIAGKGPLRAPLEQQVADLGLQNDVRFLGFLPEEQLPIAYQAADLTVIPSQSLEGFGLVLLESLACGTPTVCTPVGGMPEVLENFTPELITETEKTEAIAHTLAQIIVQDVTLPTRKDCHQYAADNFSWSVIGKKVRTVLLAPL